MGKTKIPWTEYTWNPITGCTPVDAGCAHCYAAAMHARRHKAHLAGKPMPPQYAEPFSTVQFHPKRLEDPMKWRKPRLVFVCSGSDLFHEDVVALTGWLEHVFAAMRAAPQHFYLLLTKRPKIAHDFLYERGEVPGWPGNFPNVMLGVSLHDQASADARIPVLLDTPPPVGRFVSYEPALAPVDWESSFGHIVAPGYGLLQGHIDWLICGGESGSGARPMHPDWARSARDQCKAAGAPFYFKQHGEWLEKHTALDMGINLDHLPWGTLDAAGNWLPETTPWNGRTGKDSEEGEYVMYRVGHKRAGRLLDGAPHDEYPEAIRAWRHGSSKRQ